VQPRTVRPDPAGPQHAETEKRSPLGRSSSPTRPPAFRARPWWPARRPVRSRSTPAFR
jgi:hypothetical protein